MRIQKLITNSTLRLRNFKTNSPQHYQYMKNTVQDMLGYACWYLTKAHVRYIKILTWLRGFLVIFLYLFWFSLCSSLFWELRDKRVDLEKFTILALKPRSHVRILIYRTWAIGSCISWRVSKIRSTRARRRCSSCSITKASKGEKMQVEIWDWEIKGLFAWRWGTPR